MNRLTDTHLIAGAVRARHTRHGFNDRGRCQRRFRVPSEIVPCPRKHLLIPLVRKGQQHSIVACGPHDRLWLLLVVEDFDACRLGRGPFGDVLGQHRKIRVLNLSASKMYASSLQLPFSGLHKQDRVTGPDPLDVGTLRAVDCFAEMLVGSSLSDAVLGRIGHSPSTVLRTRAFHPL